MCRIKIQKIGPIKDVDFTLNRINVITGPQCSGKSTIAKVVSTCSWLEKDCVRRQTCSHITRDSFEHDLFAFHQLVKFLKHNDYKIEYLGDALHILYTFDTFIVEKTSSFEQKSLGKVAYIPAERNIASLENVESLKLPDINIRGFLWDWFIIRTKYTQSNPLNLFTLGVRYYYSKEKGDVLILEDDNEIPLNAASSGLQSVTPLYACLHYMTTWIYQNREDTSYEKQETLEKAIIRRMCRQELEKQGGGVLDKTIEDEIIPNFKDVFHRVIKQLAHSSNLDSVNENGSDTQSMNQLIDCLSLPHNSRVILEEPELNLFPQSQVDLMYDILQMIDVGRDTLFINTHSPYILYALNNCMLGGLLREKIDDEELLIRKDSFVNPMHVSVWELRDGEFSSTQNNENKTIQDSEGLIRSNYFDRVMRNVMTDFKNLMNYHD